MAYENVFQRYFQNAPYATPFSSGAQAAGGATSFNLGSGENISSLSDLINSINRTGQSAALNARIPNAPALETQSSANIGSELGGQLPSDVLANLRQAAAERGVASGTVGSPNSNAAYLRALGLTSLDLTNMGQSNLTAAEGRNPAAPLFDPSTQLITPYQAGTLGLEQQRLQDELLMSRERLAQQAALSGPRGGGGQPAPDPSAYVRQPYASDLQTTFVGQSPYATTGATGSALYGGDPTAQWLASIGYGPNVGRTIGTGTYSATDEFGNPVQPAPGGQMNQQLDTEQMMADAGFA